MLTDQQIDEFLEMLAKSPTSARDMVRGLFAKAAPAVPQGEPFGYFRAEPFGWTDCAETDEGAIALYERPAAPAVPDTDELESALERLVERCNTDQFLSNDDAVIHAEATLKRIYKSRKSTATPAAPSQPVTCSLCQGSGVLSPTQNCICQYGGKEPVTLTDEQKRDIASNWFSEDWAIKQAMGLMDDYESAIAALREKGALR